MIVLIGAGGHSLACADVIESENRFRIAGFIAPEFPQKTRILDYPLLGNDETLDEILIRYSSVHIAIGQLKSSEKRRFMYQKAKERGAELPVITSPHSVKSHRSSIGEGTILMHGSIVNAGVEVGVNCILNSRSLLEHGVTIGNHCHVSTGVCINGDVSVGDGSFIGSGSIVREGVCIGKNAFIAAGQLVANNVPDGGYFDGRS